MRPKQEVRILGANIRNNLTWGSHLKTGEKAVIPAIQKKMGALWLVSKYLPKAARLRLANGIIMSRIVYLIQLWGTCKECWLREMQKVQNKAARYVTRLPRHTKVSVLLQECGWLSITQLVVYHSVLLLWKLFRENRSSHLLKRVVTTSHRGRNLQTGDRLYTRQGRILLSNLSWRVNSVTWWNDMPELLRTERRLNVFKGSLRHWVRQNTRLK